MAVSENLARVDLHPLSRELGIDNLSVRTVNFSAETAYFSTSDPAGWEEAKKWLPEDKDTANTPTHVRVIADSGQPKLIIVSGIKPGETPQSYVSVFPADRDTADVLIKKYNYAISLGLTGGLSAANTMALIPGEPGEITITKQEKFYIVETSIRNRPVSSSR